MQLNIWSNFESIMLLFFTLLMLLRVTFSKYTYQVIIPESDDYPLAQLHGTIDHPLVEYTLCHWSRLTANQSYVGAIFSYSTPSKNDDILTALGDNGRYRIFQNDYELIDGRGPKTFHWQHLCVTSNTVRGYWIVYLNGINAATGNKGQVPVEPNGLVVLGQDVERTIDNFHKSFKLKGQIAEVFMWDRVLSTHEILEVYNCRHTEDANVVNWHLNSWELRNGVRVSAVKLPCGKAES